MTPLNDERRPVQGAALNVTNLGARDMNTVPNRTDGMDQAAMLRALADKITTLADAYDTLAPAARRIVLRAAADAATDLAPAWQVTP